MSANERSKRVYTLSSLYAGCAAQRLTHDTYADGHAGAQYICSNYARATPIACTLSLTTVTNGHPPT
eukprot:6180227-Pleurochrysis_carterae.AAC.4